MTTNSLQLRLEKCAFCGEHFYSKRSDRKTCSNKCRQRMHRWRIRLVSYERETQERIFEIAKYAQYADSKPLAAQVMLRLRDELDAAIKINKIARVG